MLRCLQQLSWHLIMLSMLIMPWYWSALIIGCQFSPCGTSNLVLSTSCSSVLAGERKKFFCTSFDINTSSVPIPSALFTPVQTSSFPVSFKTSRNLRASPEPESPLLEVSSSSAVSKSVMVPDPKVLIMQISLHSSSSIPISH